MNHDEQTRNLGTYCLCSDVCQACNKHGIDTAYCESACAFHKSPDCNELCSAFFQGGNRDDTNTQPPLNPDDTTEAPQPKPTSPPATEAPQPKPTSPPVTEPPTESATSPPTPGTCRCTILCQQCEASGVDPALGLCNDVCNYANAPNCVELCSDYIENGGVGIRDDTGTNPQLPGDGDPNESPPAVPCPCKRMCNPSCGTKPCESVCELADLPDAECTPKCKALLHLP